MSDEEVVLTDHAMSKSWRLWPDYEMIERTQGRDGDIYRKGDTDEYHLASDPYALVVVPEDGKLVVITQMHHHVDYEADEMYHPVEDFGE